MKKKCAVFILLGQSNAVGHGVPMVAEDIIEASMKNVFGLSRAENQSFDRSELYWSGYTSHGMNLAEEQDNTYSLANCLAALWQQHIDSGNSADLPDLYIVHVAIGAQGVSEGYMWYPEKERILIPGRLGTVNIALFPFCSHIFSLLDQSFASAGKDYEIIGLHWRGGENDVSVSKEYLSQHLKKIYRTIFDSFSAQLHSPPIVFHKIVCPDRMNDLDSTGNYLARMHEINAVFEKLVKEYPHASLFDVTKAPQFIPDIRGNGIFIKDAVHYTPEVNRWVAGQILEQYAKAQTNTPSA